MQRAFAGEQQDRSTDKTSFADVRDRALHVPGPQGFDDVD